MQTRRQFVVRAGTVAASAILSPSALAAGLGSARPAALARGGRFSEGVMSGEPTPNGITLWTRVAGIDGRDRVELEVATDKTFRHVVARKGHRRPTRRSTTPSRRGSTDLKPHEQYYYRFSTAHTDSKVGRFRTALPADSKQPVQLRLLVLPGLHARLLQRPRGDGQGRLRLRRLPRRLHLRRDLPHGQADGTGVRDDKIGTRCTGARQPGHRPRGDDATRTTCDKYSLYRSDPSAAQAVHAHFPTVMLWDDHEVQDNYAGGEADGGLPPQQRYTAARKAAAYKAFFKSMPAYARRRQPKRQYRTLQFGKTVDLVIMDQRQYRANQPCDDAVGVPPAPTATSRATSSARRR